MDVSDAPAPEREPLKQEVEIDEFLRGSHRAKRATSALNFSGSSKNGE